MYTTQDDDLNVAKVIKHVVIALIVITVLFGSFGTIGAGERGVKTRFKAVVGTLPQGLYFKLPLIESVTTINVKTQVVTYEKENPLTSASKDLQDVKISTVVNYHIEPKAVESIYTKYNSSESFEAQVIRPAVRDVVKATASQFTAEELVTKRAEFTATVLGKLNERLLPENVVIEGANITNFEFSPSFTQAIENKVTAVQNAEAQKNKLEQVKYEAQQSIEKAKAEAESIRIQAQAINAQGGADYVQLQAIAKWNGILPSQMTPNSAVPFINLK